MENISVAVITDDGEYGRALGLSLLSVCRSFIIKVILKENFTKTLESIYSENSTLSEEYDLILWDGPEAMDVYGDNLIMMTEKPSMVSRDHKRKKFSVYKYDSAQIMVGNLFEIYAGLTGRKPVNVRKNNVRLFSFVSSSGGSGCSTLAMAVCQELCRFNGAKVLYISFEDIESTGEFIDNVRSVSPLNHYLYMLFRENSIAGDAAGRKTEDSRLRQGSFIESYIIRDEFGIEAFAPTGGLNPLAGLDSHETMVFLSALIESGRYDVIVTDCGNGTGLPVLTCVQMAEKVCLVSSPDVNGLREEQYLQYMMFRCGENIVDRMLKVKNRSSRSKAAEKSESSSGEAMLDTSIYIEKTGSIIQEGNVRKMILENEFGSRISTLTGKLMASRQQCS